MRDLLIILICICSISARAIGQKIDSAWVKSQVDSMLKVATELRAKGNDTGSIEVIGRARDFAKTNFGDQSVTYAKATNDLATMYFIKGDYRQAEMLMLEVMHVRKKKLGERHNEYAAILSNLGLLYHRTYRLEKAEAFLLDSKKIYEYNLNEKNMIRYARALNNLGILNKDMGRYREAERYHVEVRKIRATRLPENDPEITRNLNNLAIVYRVLGRYEEADSLLSIVKKIWDKQPRKPRDYINTLNTMASIRAMQHDFGKALDIYFSMDALYQKDQRKSLEFAIYNSNIASVLINMNKPEQVDSFLNIARAIIETDYGKENQFYVGLMQSYLMHWQRTGKREPLEETVIELSDIVKKMLVRESVYLSENELFQYAGLLEETFGLYTNFAIYYKSETLAKTAFDNMLFLKGFTLSELIKTKRLLEKTSGETYEMYLHWKDMARKIADRYSLPLSERKALGQMEKEADQLEKELNKRIRARDTSRIEISWQDLFDRLKPDEAVVEFIRFEYNDTTHFGALVLRNDGHEHDGKTSRGPVIVHLCEEKTFDEQFDCTDLDDTDCVNMRYPQSRPSSLYSLIWEPLNPRLSGVSSVYFSAVGQLHLLDLGALNTGNSKMLSEQYRLVQLGSTRQIFHRDIELSPAHNTPNAAILFGGVRYEMDSTAIWAANDLLDSLDQFALRGEDLPFDLADSTGRRIPWKFLPGTEKEVEDISGILKTRHFNTTLFEGYSATEEAFKRIGQHAPPPRILHLATHGFFFPKSFAANSGKGQGAGMERAFDISEHPMIRSGIIMAGANYAWLNRQPLREGMEDGILTAYEISQTNLDGVELVVLSACQTGLGDVRGNEGVYGLQRAFKIAGARYLVMSLQPVPDEAAREFMTLLYQNWLSPNGNDALPDAFRATKSAMRKKYRYKPENWAGWILVE